MARCSSRAVALIALALVAACDDEPTQPRTGCDAPHGCEIEGFDLAVMDAEIRFTDDQPFRSQVDAHVVVPGDSIRVVARVVNRGTEPAPAAFLHVYSDWFRSLGYARIDALEPGEELDVGFRVATPDLSVWGEPLIVLNLFLDEDDEGTVLDYEDALLDNNVAPGFDAPLAYHPLVPIVSFDLTLPDTVRALEPFLTSARITNSSPFVAMPELTWGLCFLTDFTACDEAPHGPLIHSGTINAGASAVVAVGLFAPHDGLFVAPGDERFVAACQFDATWADRTCIEGGLLVVEPNVAAACDPELVVPPDTFDVTAQTACDPSGDGQRVHVVAFDAIEGQQYRLRPFGAAAFQVWILRPDDSRLLDASIGGADELFEIPETGRYLIVTHLGLDPAAGVLKQIALELL